MCTPIYVVASIVTNARVAVSPFWINDTGRVKAPVIPVKHFQACLPQSNSLRSGPGPSVGRPRMTQPRRDGFCIRVAWLTRPFGGEDSCEWSTRFRVQHGHRESGQGRHHFRLDLMTTGPHRRNQRETPAMAGPVSAGVLLLWPAAHRMSGISPDRPIGQTQLLQIQPGCRQYRAATCHAVVSRPE